MQKDDVILSQGGFFFLIMKLRSLSLILLLNALMMPLVQAEVFLVDGVNVNDITLSTRFYDNGKGYYWQYSPLRSELKQEYTSNGNSYEFLEDWCTGSYINDPDGEFSVSDVEGLMQDWNTCWYNVSVNLITYWQTSYGMFYTGSSPLPSGYIYNKEYLAAFGGTQSLETGKLFYDNWENEGGRLAMATSWYFAGRNDWPELKENAAPGGYFAEYFGDSQGRRIVFFGNRAGAGNLAGDIISLGSVGKAFESAFGFDENDKGRDGVLLYLSLVSPVGGHALTCYGYNTDEAGQIRSIIVSNPDDMLYGTFEVFLKIEGGEVYLYEDAALTQRWNYAQAEWSIDSLGYIDTPEVLRQLRADYTDKRKAQVWNGALNTWSADYEKQDAAEEMPVSSTGWDVYAESGSAAGHFHTFYDETRGVEFNDHAGSHQNITVSGVVKAADVAICADKYDYAFTAAAGASVNVNHLKKSGEATAVFSGLDMSAAMGTSLTGGTLDFNEVNLATPWVRMDSHTRLGLKGTTISGSVLVGDHSTLHVYAGGATINSDLVLQDGAIVFFDISAGHIDESILSLGGNLDLQGFCKFEINDHTLADEQSYRLITFANGWDGSSQLSHISLSTGFLTYENNILTYTYSALAYLKWDSVSTGQWNSSSWDGSATAAAGSANVSFDVDAEVTVGGLLTPGYIDVSEGAEVVLKNDGTGMFGGTRDVRLAADSVLVTELTLNGRDIYLSEGAVLEYDVSTENKISEIELAAGASLVLGGNAQHIIYGSDHLAGDIMLKENNTLLMSLRGSKTLSGTVTTAAGTNLIFANGSGSQDITYTLTKGTAAVAGQICIGRESDTRSTTLSISGDTSANYHAESMGVLQMKGGSEEVPAVFAGSLTGSGTLEIAKDSFVNLVVRDNVSPLSNTSTLLVKGVASIGSDCSWTVVGGGAVFNETGAALTTTVTDNVVVDGGTLTAWVDSTRVADYGAPMVVNQLTLSNGGFMRFENTFSRNESGLNSLAVKIGSLNIGKGSNQFEYHAESRDAWYKTITEARISIDSVAGAGDITFLADNLNDATVTVVELADVSGFSGNVGIKSEIRGNAVNRRKLHIAALELAEECSMRGAVSVTGHTGTGAYINYQDGVVEDFQYRAMLGIRADSEIGGLDGNDTAYLYAGKLTGGEIAVNLVDSGRTKTIGNEEKKLYVADSAAEIAGIQGQIASENHTLCVNTGKDSHCFQGTVLGGVSLEKHGAGTQTFSGNVEHFSGSLDVQEGTLAFTGVQGTLSVENLSLSAGATLETNATIVATGAVDFHAAPISALQQALSLDASEVVFNGTASMMSHLDLAQATTLYMGTVVDMCNFNLNIDSLSPTALSLTLSGTLPEQGSCFDLLLFTNVGQLSFGAEVQDAGNWQADSYFTNEYITGDTRLVYDGSNVGLCFLMNVPEPSSTTFGLLGLAAFAARRRRK